MKKLTHPLALPQHQLRRQEQLMMGLLQLKTWWILPNP
jgi:hypothetical protein